MVEGAAARFGKGECAMFPFLDDARELIRSKGFTADAFGTDPDMVPFIDLAMERIRAAAEGRIYSASLAANELPDRDIDREVFSFFVAILLLKMSGGTLARRFALAESRRAESFMEKSLRRDTSSMPRSTTLRVLSSLFGISVKIEDDTYAIPVADYVRHSITFHEREWKLVNRTVSAGTVRLSVHQVIRVIRDDLAGYIHRRVLDAPAIPMMANFEAPVAELRATASKLEPQYVKTTTEHPPCIKHAIEVLSRGENLPHAGRFMLATFLLNRGQTVEQVAPLFKSAPDYNERVTMYQLRNLSGQDGGTRYTCPSCDKLRTQSLCFETDECAGIANPLQFGRRRK